MMMFFFVFFLQMLFSFFVEDVSLWVFISIFFHPFAWFFGRHHFVKPRKKEKQKKGLFHFKQQNTKNMSLVTIDIDERVKKLPRPAMADMVFAALEASSLTAPEFCSHELLHRTSDLTSSRSPPRKATLQLFPASEEGKFYITDAMPQLMDTIKMKENGKDADIEAYVVKVVRQLPGTKIYEVELRSRKYESINDFKVEWMPFFIAAKDGRQVGLTVWLQEFELGLAEDCLQQTKQSVVAAFLRQNDDDLINKQFTQWLTSGFEQSVTLGRVDLYARQELWPDYLKRAFDVIHHGLGGQCDGTWIDGRCIPRVDTVVHQAGEVPMFSKFLENTNALQRDMATVADSPEPVEEVKPTTTGLSGSADLGGIRNVRYGREEAVLASARHQREMEQKREAVVKVKLEQQIKAEEKQVSSEQIKAVVKQEADYERRTEQIAEKEMELKHEVDVLNKEVAEAQVAQDVAIKEAGDVGAQQAKVEQAAQELQALKIAAPLPPVVIHAQPLAPAPALTSEEEAYLTELRNGAVGVEAVNNTPLFYDMYFPAEWNEQATASPSLGNPSQRAAVINKLNLIGQHRANRNTNLLLDDITWLEKTQADIETFTNLVNDALGGLLDQGRTDVNLIAAMAKYDRYRFLLQGEAKETINGFLDDARDAAGIQQASSPSMMIGFASTMTAEDITNATAFFYVNPGVYEVWRQAEQDLRYKFKTSKKREQSAWLLQLHRVIFDSYLDQLQSMGQSQSLGKNQKLAIMWLLFYTQLPIFVIRLLQMLYDELNGSADITVAKLKMRVGAIVARFHSVVVQALPEFLPMPDVIAKGTVLADDRGANMDYFVYKFLPQLGVTLPKYVSDRI